jgi:hypothetical protein
MATKRLANDMILRFGNSRKGVGMADPGSDPRSKLGEEVAAQMDAIETDFGDNYEIGNVVTIVEVITPAGAGVRVRCNQQPWIGLGLLRVAEKVLESSAGGPGSD